MVAAEGSEEKHSDEAEALEKQAAALLERARAIRGKRPSVEQPQQERRPLKKQAQEGAGSVALKRAAPTEAAATGGHPKRRATIAGGLQGNFRVHNFSLRTRKMTARSVEQVLEDNFDTLEAANGVVLFQPVESKAVQLGPSRFQRVESTERRRVISCEIDPSDLAKAFRALNSATAGVQAQEIPARAWTT